MQFKQNLYGLTIISLSLLITSAASAVINDPTDIPNAVLWLDASDLGSISSSGSNVTQWNDKSGAANHFAQGTIGSQPQTGTSSVNGLNTLTFSGSQHLLGPSAVLSGGDDEYTYFAVWNPTTTSGARSVYEQGSGGSQRSAILTVGNRYGFNGESNDRHDLVPFDTNTFRVTDMEINNTAGGANVRVYDNGDYFFGTTGNPGALNVNTNGTAVGKKVNVNGEFFQGQIAEIIVYDRVLTNDERADVSEYFNSKFAFSNVEPGLVHRWSFNDGTANDSVGSADGTLNNGASIVGGQLQLDGVNDFMQSAPIDQTIGVKSLVTWVTPDNLTQRSGSVLTLENPTGGDVFDGIVYGEQTAGQWMNGSNFFQRTVPGNGGALEGSTDEIMLAIVYGADNSITLYRDGVFYADGTQGSLQSYPEAIADVLIGLRHFDIAGGTGTATGNDQFWAGLVNEARIYNVALSEEDIQRLFRLGADQVDDAAVPEPASVGLLALGLAGLIRRRRAA